MSPPAAHTAACPERGTKPRLRGVSHEYAFFVSLGCGVALILAASDGRARVAAIIYAFAVSNPDAALDFIAHTDYKNWFPLTPNPLLDLNTGGPVPAFAYASADIDLSGGTDNATLGVVNFISLIALISPMLSEPITAPMPKAPSMMP